MKSYFVTWEIVRAPGSMANVFDVIECDTDGVPTRVDLSEESPIEMEEDEDEMPEVR